MMDSAKQYLMALNNRLNQGMPHDRQGMIDFATNMAVGATTTPEATLGQAMQAKRLASILGKGAEASDPVGRMDQLIKLAKQVGVSTMEGKVPRSIEDIVNDIVKAKTMNAQITKYMRVPDIPQINLSDKVQIARKFIQDAATGKMKGSYGKI